MKTDKIDVAVACGTNSEGYAEFLLWSIGQTASRPDRFRFKFGLNGPDIDAKRLERLKDIADVEVFEAFSGLGYCSKSHAITLDKTYARMETELSMVCDIDIAFLEPGWDELFIAKIEEGNVGVGPEYARTYHLRGGFHKHLGFPNLLATLLKTEAMKSECVSFMPAKDLVLTDEDAPHFGLEPGIKTRRDTGWELSYKLRRAGHVGVAMKMLSYGDPESKLLVGPDKYNGNEFHLDGIPVLTHMGRSSMRAFGKHPAAIRWEQRVRQWIEERRCKS